MQDVQTRQDTVRPKRPLKSWFDVRSRKAGSWAFALNRLTGLGLTFYLIVHLGILTILLQGEQAWDDFVLIVKSPFFLATQLSAKCRPMSTIVYGFRQTTRSRSTNLCFPNRAPFQ